MSDIEQEIRTWLHQQQDWLQEAVEKLLASGSLTDSEIQAITDRLKTTSGQKVTTHRTFEGVGTIPASSTVVHLLEIGDICGIENLCPHSPLKFGTGNLAVIYGPNGSGKTGYVRVIKRACGKPHATELKSNVFECRPAKQQCQIRYSLAGSEQLATWQVNDTPIQDLRAVDVFDADAATFYISQEKAISYTPSTVTLFEALATVCDKVKMRLLYERDRLVSTLPNLPPEYRSTNAGKVYVALRYDHSVQEIQCLTQWGKDNEEELKKLTERLNADDPAKLAHLKRKTKSQLDQLGVELKNAASAAGPQQLDILRNARRKAHQKRKIATEAAAAQLGNAKLDGIGTETWNALWSAARLYSQTAYPKLEFPVTENGALCVLCHQELAREAQNRLQEFETFVQGAVETEARSAEMAYSELLEGLPTQWNDEEIRTRCQAAGLTEEGWAEKIGSFWSKLGKTRNDLLNGEADAEAVAIEPPDRLLNEIACRAESLEHEALQNDEDAENFDRERAVQEKLNLEALRWTAQQATAIHYEVTRLMNMRKYEKWEQLANSRKISLMAGRVAEKVITQAYVDRFNQELETLGASRIKVELIKTRTQKGQALHGLRLKGVELTTENDPETVLSEGERRVVSLAAFLADVAEKPYSAPFIFDDPISSLDQDFEWQVATRLAQLARSRQVLVFTHRLSLYGAMEDAAKKVGEEWKRRNLQQRCIESFSGSVGHPADDAVWNATTKKANNILLTRLDEAKRAGETGGASAYQSLAQGICSDFRKLIERTVEDDLLNRVVRRHRRSITTDNRLKPLANISPNDCKIIDDLMTKYSGYEHSQPDEAPIPLPDEPELRKDLESLKKWREAFKKRPAEVGV